MIGAAVGSMTAAEGDSDVSAVAGTVVVISCTCTEVVASDDDDDED